jgi:glycosyltransferase involved in cell wall biosynthesis
MEGQAAAGHDVAYFFGGRHYPGVRRPRLHRWRLGGVAMLEVLGSPIPVGIDQGTRFPDLELHEPATEKLFDAVLEEVRPEVVHVQELAGLPSSVVDIAQRRRVPLVMTLQDYFPLCPTVKLYDADGQICMRRDPAPQCVRCCRDAPLGTRHMRDMTTAFELRRLGGAFPRARDAAWGVLGPLLRRLPSGLPVDERAHGADAPAGQVEAYRRRRATNVERLSRFDALVGVSSRVTEIYSDLGVDPARLRTLHLTVGHLEALRPRHVEAPGRPLRFATLAGLASVPKGSRLVLDVVRRLEQMDLDGAYEVHVHGLVDPAIEAEVRALRSVRLRGPYSLGDLDALLDTADVGLVPSIWEEAYAHTGLEFVAKGIPVIANALGGSPDFAVPGESGWLNRSAGGQELAEIMAAIARDPREVVRFSRRLLDRRDELIKPLDRHLVELDELYREVIERSAGDA